MLQNGHTHNANAVEYRDNIKDGPPQKFAPNRSFPLCSKLIKFNKNESVEKGARSMSL